MSASTEAVKVSQSSQGPRKVAEASTTSIEVVEDNCTPIEVLEASVEVGDVPLRLHGSSGSVHEIWWRLWKLPRASMEVAETSKNVCESSAKVL